MTRAIFSVGSNHRRVPLDFLAAARLGIPAGEVKGETMRRGAVLYLTECPEKRFEAMDFRGQLPFAPTGELGRRATDTLQNAFELGLMMAFMDEGGIALEPARAAAVSCCARFPNGRQHPDLTIHPLNLPRSAGDLWATIAHLRFPETGAGSEPLFADGLNSISPAACRTRPPTPRAWRPSTMRAASWCALSA